MTPGSSADSTGAEEADIEYENRVRAQQRRDHTNAILNGTWNEGQPDSPHLSPLVSAGKEIESCPLLRRTPPPHSSRIRAISPNSSSPSKRARINQFSEDRRTHSLLGPNAGGDGHKSAPDCGMTRGETLASEHGRPSSDGNISPPNEPETFFSVPAAANAGNRTTTILTQRGLSQEGTAGSRPKPFKQGANASKFGTDDDAITDTVGAIAIDMYGQIAAGSSSGGIGMKHRGRVGPAALVGIGTAVIPADEGDPEGISVAAVTSGTGEHMATTMASQKCAERLYHNTRRAQGGADVEATEEEAIESFVQADFMSHPGVIKSTSAGAIGVMAVKKTPYGYFLHFAHNTDSFALASMHSNERDAKCVMSRLGDHGNVVRGGRKIRVD
jgi:taspase (threonine aspartase 1)